MPEFSWMNRFILGDSRGSEVAARIDATIARLPGLAWFDRMARLRQESVTRLGKLDPVPVAVIAGD